MRIDPEGITNDATLNDLGLDSLAAVELVDILSGRLGVTLDDDAFNLSMTITQAVQVLQAAQTP
ncbi:acyl carrier protein [Streptomyces sp. NPDC001415]